MDKWTPSVENQYEYMQRFILLKHLLRNLAFLQAAQPSIQKLGLFDEFPDLNMVWTNTRLHYDMYKELPPRAALEFAIEASFLNEEDPDGSLHIRMAKIISKIYDISVEELSIPLANDILKEHLKTHSFKQLQTALDQGDTDRITQELEQTTRVLDTEFVAKITERNPFRGDINTFLATAKRIPLGIDFIDDMQDGGVLPGTVTGFVIPTKVGKTTIVWQGMAECVVRKIHAVIVSFEQFLEGDLTLRACVLATNSQRKDWEDNDLSKVSPKIKEIYDKVQTDWATYLHFYDDWLNPETPLHSVEQMFDTIMEDLAAKGIKPEVFFIDWWGNMETKLRSSLMVHDAQERRQKSHEWLHRIKVCTQKYGLRTYLFHQKSGAATGRPKAYIGGGYDAMENKGFPMMLDFCFTTSGKDSEGNVTFALTEARSAANKQVTVYLDGQACRFIGRAADYGANTMTEIKQAKENDVFNLPTRKVENKDAG